MCERDRMGALAVVGVVWALYSNARTVHSRFQRLPSAGVFHPSLRLRWPTGAPAHAPSLSHAALPGLSLASPVHPGSSSCMEISLLDFVAQMGRLHLSLLLWLPSSFIQI